MNNMTTPIADFVKRYCESDFSRMHMPAHKGSLRLGCEALDITEINGADVLYSANGIIDESENNATELFGTLHTFYSTEGSTLAIKSMLALVKKQFGEKTKILAARNVHKAFVYACGLLDIDVEWLYPTEGGHLCDCAITPSALRERLSSMSELPCALYVTSPTYLGKILDISGLSAVCKEFSVLLLVDNAHGAYLAFETPSQHPIALGADVCCDSAHKTLPTLTGGAYLHISDSFNCFSKEEIRSTMSIFASTSPSYLILQSLDLTNKYISNGFYEKLSSIETKIDKLKKELCDIGFYSTCDERLKIVIEGNCCSGALLARHLRENKIEPEYAAADALVLMFSTETKDEDIKKIKSAISSFIQSKQSAEKIPARIICERALSFREAIFSQSERIPVKNSEGRICASPTVSCPPAIPPVVSGEIINSAAISTLLYYGIDEIEVVK